MPSSSSRSSSPSSTGHTWSAINSTAACSISPGRISEATFARHLHRADIPDVDLFIRTSGEQRASNFLLWQAAYAEYVFQDKLWPDYDRRDLWEACEEYVNRNRRFGRAE